ncbi:16S rRNA (guanine(527)-N(7))-methyltransferase RsmG, partial [Staphylococcus pseudintermedius]
RQIVTIEKRSQTPKKYPRKPGTPNKSPLVE